MSRLLFIDTETGGLNPQKHSLLSIGLIVWDSRDGELYSAQYYLKNENYRVTRTAQKMNGITSEKQEQEGVSGVVIIKALEQIKLRYFASEVAIPLAGHNTQFDVQFIKQMYAANRRSYEKVFSHRIIDTYSILAFLEGCGLIPADIKSSAAAFKHFGIRVDGRHTALGDARATRELYEKLLVLVKENLTGSNGKM